MLIMYFNALRDKGIKVNPEDTLWINIFADYVLKNDLISDALLNLALNRTLEVLTVNQTSKDVVALLKKFKIDYSPIDEKYLKELQRYNEIFKD